MRLQRLWCQGRQPLVVVMDVCTRCVIEGFRRMRLSRHYPVLPQSGAIGIYADPRILTRAGLKLASMPSTSGPVVAKLLAPVAAERFLAERPGIKHTQAAKVEETRKGATERNEHLARLLSSLYLAPLQDEDL